MHSRYLACPSYRHTPTSTHIDFTCIRDPAHKWGTGQSLVSSHRPTADTGPVPQNPALLQDPLCSLRDAPHRQGSPRNGRLPSRTQGGPQPPGYPQTLHTPAQNASCHQTLPQSPSPHPTSTLLCCHSHLPPHPSPPANSGSLVPSPNTQPVSTGAGPGQCPGAGPAVGSPGRGGGLPGT